MDLSGIKGVSATGRRTRGSMPIRARRRTSPGSAACPASALVSAVCPGCRIRSSLRPIPAGYGCSEPDERPLPQMKQDVRRVIWMYCLRGWLAPPLRAAAFASRPLEHLNNAFFPPRPIRRGDRRRVGSACRSCRSRRCNDSALGALEVEVGACQELDSMCLDRPRRRARLGQVWRADRERDVQECGPSSLASMVLPLPSGR